MSQAARRRVVVVFEPLPAGDAALAAAAALAARLSADLAGVFLEDVNLTRLAALPFAQELGRVSAMLRPIQSQDIEREFRVQAARARSALEAAAAGLRLAWTFEAVRGPGLRPVLELVQALDLVVLAAGPPLAAPDVARPLAVLFDGSEAAWRALDAGQLLAAASGVNLVVLVNAAERTMFEAARREVDAWLAGRNAIGRAIWLRERAAGQVCKAVRDAHAGLLFWHDGETVRDERLLASLVAGLKCPLVLVG